MVTKTPYPAQGLVTETAVFSEQFWLDSGGQPMFENHVIEAGQVLEAGSVLGMVTATDELKFSDPGQGDGSEEVYAILMEPLDTTAAADEVAVLTFSNRMININALRYHASWTKYKLRAALSRKGITVRNTLYSAL